MRAFVVHELNDRNRRFGVGHRRGHVVARFVGIGFARGIVGRYRADVNADAAGR